MSRVAFSTWGRGAGADIDGVVRTNELRTAIDAVVRRVERETGLHCCGGPRLDSTTQGKPIYQATFGRRVHGGGYEPKSEVWFSIESGGEL